MGQPMRAKTSKDSLRDMPRIYFERADATEQARHEAKLARLEQEQGLLIEPIQDSEGGWHVELITRDWDEPGLLDKIFETVLRSVHIPGGIAIRRARIFTGRNRQVVNILNLATRSGGPVQRKHCAMLMKELAAIRPGERGTLESIEHTPFPTLIPFVTEFPTIDNERSEEFTFLSLRVAELSNRFTSILLHFLARSELWLNIQIAEFAQEEDGGYYQFYVVDKTGKKLADTHYTRLSMVRVLEAMNRMLMRFNVHYILRERAERIDRNEKTIYHSRPDPGDFLLDLANIRDMGKIKGLGHRLSVVVDQGLLDSKSLYFLKKVESFVRHHGEHIHALVESGPAPEDIALCREYFELRRKALRITMPLFERMADMPEASPKLSDTQRLRALCRPAKSKTYALDARYELYHTSAIWLADPGEALDPFLLMARTDCYLREDLLDAIEAA
ncbi:MAG: hypothetical protein O7C61_10325, partial [SAR324 cluster bacterium]|nr:hypothetical protein [SAR324 cluster bacterium]